MVWYAYAFTLVWRCTCTHWRGWRIPVQKLLSEVCPLNIVHSVFTQRHWRSPHLQIVSLDDIYIAKLKLYQTLFYSHYEGQQHTGIALFLCVHTCTGPASAARMPSRVCPSLGGAPLGSRGLVSMELQSTWREAAPRCTLRATLCQRKSIRASTPSPVKTQLTRSAAGSSALARRDKVPSGPLKSTESWGVFGNGGYNIERKVIYECTQVLMKHQTMCSTCQTP